MHVHDNCNSLEFSFIQVQIAVNEVVAVSSGMLNIVGERRVHVQLMI